MLSCRIYHSFELEPYKTSKYVKVTLICVLDFILFLRMEQNKIDKGL